jgi:uncharacterized RDD family membrane protein YckC
MISGGPPPPPPPPVPGSGGQYPPSPYLPPPQYPTTYYAGPAHAGPAPGIGYAGFWIRFIAAVIDGIIVGVPLFILFLVIEGTAFKSYLDCVNNAIAAGSYSGTCGTLLGYGSIGYFDALSLIVQLVYFSVLWSSLGGTLGQRMLGLHVVDAATGRNIGIGRAVGRYIGYVISAAVLLIGLIWAAFDPRKQGWHDKMASTFVVRKV